jgi:pyruvate dehydrogenase E2 component (dihydrolipoamide acetyltransferase)
LSLIAPLGFGETINRDFVLRFPSLREAVEAREILGLLVADTRLIGAQMIEDVLGYLRRPGIEQALHRIVAATFPGGRQIPQLCARLHEITVPVRIIWGEQDRILPLLAHDALRLAVDVVARTGHLPHIEASMRVNRLLLPR